MKILLSFILVSFTIHKSEAQNITGSILSSSDSLSVEGAHILNITKKKMAISSQLGYFSIRGEIGDTLVVSNVNFLTKQFVVNTSKPITIALNPANIQLEEVIVSNMPITENDFRKKLIDMPMQDNGKFIPYGVTPGKLMPQIPVIYDSEEINSVGYAVRNPLRFAASKVNPKFQEKVKYWSIQADLDDSFIRNKKYNRELVASLTNLESDDLTDFISFMEFSIEFINNSSAYEIAERIKEKFEEYQQLNKEK